MTKQVYIYVTFDDRFFASFEAVDGNEYEIRITI